MPEKPLSLCTTWPIGRFIKCHLVLPLLLWSGCLVVFQFTELDVWLARHFYNAQLQLWPYREHWLLQGVIHKAGRLAVYVLGGFMLVALLLSLRGASRWASYREALLFLVLAGISGPLVVTYFKSHTVIYCPWDVALFGGAKPHVKLFDRIVGALAVGHCFPAGHSSLGFTWVNLYFLGLVVKPAYKFYGLAVGLGMGMVFAAAQEIRGAHFLSHDLFSLALCWFCSLAVFMLCYGRQWTEVR